VLGVRQSRNLGLEAADLGTHDEALPLDYSHHGREHVILNGLILRDQV
jgi:hypothetical protein